ncbi:hypothetical protein [Spartinivicinus poritis]|uniref:Uncharacterized protein n=1 Tax=Spartinivicinus poritis TaxID=2994640 RepID=A0ABT5U3M3_9GAMM|nr:hypothetical protein [Spartinivicinus sp. A2-2]MDE1460972.1 hypothetical protein [Spartinivicinus sp. A2-2]
MKADYLVIVLGVIALVFALIADYGSQHWFEGETLHQAYLNVKGELASNATKTEPAFKAPVSPIIDLLSLVKYLYALAAILGVSGLSTAVVVRIKGIKSLASRIGLATNAAGLIIICFIPNPWL